MAAPVNVLILLCLFVSVFTKKLHEKQTLEAKDKEAKSFMAILNNQGFLKNIRMLKVLDYWDVVDYHDVLKQYCFNHIPEGERDGAKHRRDIKTILDVMYVRHVKAVTESVLDHLIGEIKQQYLNGKYNANSPIPRLIRNLNKELKRNERRKLQKEKKEKKNENASKKKSLRKKKPKMQIMTTTEQTIGIIFRNK